MSASFISSADLLQHAHTERERYAMQVFDFNEVNTKMKDLATKGGHYLRVSQEYPFDLSGTKAAKGLVKKLNQSGYECRWEPCHVREKIDGRETGYILEYPELCIQWGSVKRTGGAIAIPAE